MWKRRTLAGVTFLVASTAAAIGCASTVVKKDPGPHTRGVRYYRPKPYLLIQQATTTSKELSSKQNALGGIDRTVAFVGDELRMSVEWLPDFTEEYAIQARTGIGKNNTKVTLADGWRLEKVDVTIDSQASEVIKAVAGLLGTEPKLLRPGGSIGGSTGGPGSGAAGDKRADIETKDAIAVYGHEVPLGYYESVIGHGPDGKRRMFGWRYVGFAPFANCPIDGQGAACQTCDTADLYGLAAYKNKLVFRRLRELADDMRPLELVSDQRDPPPPPPTVATKEELEQAVIGLTDRNDKVARAVGLATSTPADLEVTYEIKEVAATKDKVAQNVVAVTVNVKKDVPNRNETYLESQVKDYFKGALSNVQALRGRVFDVTADVKLPPAPK